MKRVFIYLSLLAMLVMIATPVLGCCGVGHDNDIHSAPVKTVATSNCHDPETTVLDDIQDPNASCPSCENCVDQVVDRVDAGTLTVDAAPSNVAILSSGTMMPGAHDWRLPPTTGPPLRRDPSPVDSPAARNDRLLI